MTSGRTLHVFPFSHFSEKGMWILDYKGVDYAVDGRLDPFVRQRTARLTGGSSTLPVFEDGATVVSDSTDLALYAERQWPARPLLPTDESARAECLKLEDWADKVLGVQARLWLFAHVLYDDPQMTRKLLDTMPVPTSLVMLGFPLIRLGMTTALNIDTTTKKRSAAHLHEALQMLNGKLKEQSYLVGDTFTLADLTVCALLAPLCDSNYWTIGYRELFEWRADICRRHGRRRLLTDPIPSAGERRRRGLAA